MKIDIKSMTSIRCIRVVEIELRMLKIKCRIVILGQADVYGVVTPELLNKLDKRLHKFGLSIIYTKEEVKVNKQEVLINNVSKVIIDMIVDNPEKPKISYSKYISQKMGYSYKHLSTIYSDVKKITLQQNIINQKIILAKELLIQGILKHIDIALKLHYTDEPHFSKQFKKETGISPKHFVNKYKKTNPVQPNMML